MKRYEIEQEEEQWATMEEWPEGDWVKYDDVLTLLDEFLKDKEGFGEGNYSESAFINDIISALEDLT